MTEKPLNLPFKPNHPTLQPLPGEVLYSWDNIFNWPGIPVPCRWETPAFRPDVAVLFALWHDAWLRQSTLLDLTDDHGYPEEQDQVVFVDSRETGVNLARYTTETFCVFRTSWDYEYPIQDSQNPTQDSPLSYDLHVEAPSKDHRITIGCGYWAWSRAENHYEVLHETPSTPHQPTPNRGAW